VASLSRARLSGSCCVTTLAVLNSCLGGRTDPADPHAGLADILVRREIPAVIAMQFEVTDRVAAEFAPALYGALAAGRPVDAAVAEARKAMYAISPVEWATPVLYLRGDNALLFDIMGEAPPAGHSQPSGADPQARLAQVMGVRIDTTSNSPIVVLKEEHGDRYIPIWIGAPEAVSISYAQQGTARDHAIANNPNHALPHDVLQNILHMVGIQLISATIIAASSGSFSAVLAFSNGATVAARAADAIALALYTEAAVLVRADVINEVGVLIPDFADGEVAQSSDTRSSQLTGPASARDGSAALFPVTSALSHVEAFGVRVETPSNQPVILLKERNSLRYLPIRITAVEATGIALTLEGTPREKLPLTYDFFCIVLHAINTEILYIRITKIAEGMYFCDLTLSGGARTQASVGDSIALAVRTGATILVTTTLLDADSTEISSLPERSVARLTRVS
jgi:uncharacterized protein